MCHRIITQTQERTSARADRDGRGEATEELSMATGGNLPVCDGFYLRRL